jgi:hypothetical protein
MPLDGRVAVNGKTQGPKFSAAEDHDLRRDGALDPRHKILRGEIRQQPDAGAFHGRLDKKSVVVSIDAPRRLR